jgi:hypothetical protein
MRGSATFGGKPCGVNTDHLLPVREVLQGGVLDREQHVGHVAVVERVGRARELQLPARIHTHALEGSSMPVSGSSSNSPVALLAEVNEINSGSRRTIMVWNESAPLTTREIPEAISVARTPWTGGISATIDTRPA